jgi:two-component system cell cycle sensor histidine kinase/response regulator CckA
MTNSLRVLIIDDSEDDTRLITNELQRGGFDLLFERVNSPEAIKAALEQKTWDVVISNFVVSQCTALEALALLQEKNLDLPFIIVSDTMSEDIALQAMEAGAHSFFKKKNIKLLLPAVERALREAAIKRERKQMEKALKESERFLKTTIFSVGEGVVVYDRQLKYKVWNNFMEGLTGLPAQEVLGKCALDLFPHLQEEGVRLLLERALKGETICSSDTPFHIPKTGRTGWVLGTYSPHVDANGEIIGAVGIIRDITERKQAEEALRLSRLQQKALLDNIPDAAWLKDSEFRFIAVNEAIAKAAGYNTEDLVGKTDFEIWPKNAAETNRSEDQGIIATKQKKVIEQSFMDSSGKVFWVEKIKTPILDEKGKVIGTAGISRDITKRKQIEEELRKNERKYQSLYQEFLTLFDAVPENVHLISPDLKLIWINHTSAASLDKNRSDLIGQYCYQARHNRSEPCEICPVRRCFRSKTIEFDEVTTPDGVIWDLQAAPIIDDQGEVKSVVETARNITEKKKAFQEMISLQEQLRQSQKMEAIGRLAGGVAHDFNNLLTVIQGNSELALYELANNDSLKLKLGDIKKASERAADLTRQLLAFSRRQVLNLKVINLNFILEDLEKMLRRIIGEEIELITSFADDLGRVKADPGGIEQVIINLAVNAKDAMPHGGTLTIATADVELDEQHVRRHLGTLPGSYVLISVADTGVGIPKEIREQIFDPFFTTKENGKGTGLGLATVYGIVKQSGGDVHLDSEPEKGTTFKVYLPRVDEPLEEAGKKKEAKVSPRGNETILIVEDDSSVRKIAVQVLTNQGYNVLVSESGGDALLICEQEKNPIDLVLTDVVMPKMSGPELIERLKKVRKDFIVLYMSGYTDKHILKGMDDELNFIQKPFTIDVLAKKVRDALDTKKGAKRK